MKESPEVLRGEGRDCSPVTVGMIDSFGGAVGRKNNPTDRVIGDSPGKTVCGGFRTALGDPVAAKAVARLQLAALQLSETGAMFVVETVTSGELQPVVQSLGLRDKVDAVIRNGLLEFLRPEVDGGVT